MKWLVILLILQINFSYSCDEVHIKKMEENFSVCYTAHNKSYLSQHCKSVTSCFPITHRLTHVSPNQTPGFTLCYSVGGDPFFATVSNSITKIPFCKLGKNFVDIESLLLSQSK